MDSENCKGTVTEFSYYVSKALQNRMPWKSLAILLNDVAPTLNETREVISILLKELETLHLAFQAKQDELKKYQEKSETIEQVDITEKNDNEEDSSHGANTNEKTKEIDDEWYTFISNDKQEDTKAEKSLEGNEVNLLNKEDDSEQNDNENSLQCEICYRSFYEVSSLRRHKRIHTGAKPYECFTCDKRFRESSSLKKHERIHTGEVPYECMTCKKGFRHLANLKRHERTHTGEMPFECKTCNKRFSQISILKQHERIHTGELPFECKTCNKRFNQLSTLKQHEKIHTGEVSYECQTCNILLHDHFEGCKGQQFHPKGRSPEG